MARKLFTSRIDEPYYELPRTDLTRRQAANRSRSLRSISTRNSDRGGVSRPDGKQVAFRRDEPADQLIPSQTGVLDLTPNAKPRNVTADFDFDTMVSLSETAVAAGRRSSKPIWTADEGEAHRSLFKGGKEKCRVLTMRRNGSASPTNFRKSRRDEFSRHARRFEAAHVLSTPTR
jgi:hypothetical protein